MSYVVFFDDGGILNDNSKRKPEWDRLIGEYFCPKFGGIPEAWKRGNERGLNFYMKKIDEKMEEGSFDIGEFHKNLDIRWIEILFDEVGIEIDGIDKEKLAMDANKWILPQVNSYIPGMANIVKEITRLINTIHTASNELEYELHGYLTGMKIRNYFTNLYGVDLIGHFKPNKNYYKKIFEIEGLNPSQCIFIDDNLKNLETVEKTGAIPIQGNQLQEEEQGFDLYYEHPKDLIYIIKKLVNN